MSCKVNTFTVIWVNNGHEISLTLHYGFYLKKNCQGRLVNRKIIGIERLMRDFERLWWILKIQGYNFLKNSLNDF